ncbi:hypothetical protein KY329_05700 [Candidatus Woesearchaeota archaeon]|nr:hypothetical protein [Candidatus Woesearchaeota archaeon]
MGYTEEFNSKRLAELTKIAERGECMPVPEDLCKSFRKALRIEDSGPLRIVGYGDKEFKYRVALFPEEGGRARKSYGLTEDQLLELMPGRARKMKHYDMYTADIGMDCPAEVIQEVSGLLSAAAENPWGGEAISQVNGIVAGQHKLMELFELYAEACGLETANDPGAVGKLITRKETRSLSSAMRRIHGTMHDSLVFARLRQMDARDFTCAGESVYSSIESLVLCEQELAKITVEGLKKELKD